MSKLDRIADELFREVDTDDFDNEDLRKWLQTDPDLENYRGSTGFAALLSGIASVCATLALAALAVGTVLMHVDVI